MNSALLNQLIKQCPDKGNISDGFHTFDELYEHRIALFIALCKSIEEDENLRCVRAFRLPIKDGYFILGLDKWEGQQITYHLPENKWADTDFAFDLKEDEYKFDGHTSNDVLQRLKSL